MKLITMLTKITEFPWRRDEYNQSRKSCPGRRTCRGFDYMTQSFAERSLFIISKYFASLSETDQ
jgi:hypothetical protein